MRKRVGYVSLLSLTLATITAIASFVGPTWGMLDSILEPISMLGFVGVYFGWVVTTALPVFRSKAWVAGISILPNALVYGVVFSSIRLVVRLIRRNSP